MAKTSSGESKIKRVLEHLAWLKEQAGQDINRDRAYDAALLTYNAAVMLQWHFVLTTSTADQIQDQKARRRAAKLIEGFVWSAREKVEKLQDPKPSVRAVRELRDELLLALEALLKVLPGYFGLLAPRLTRDPSLERAPRLRELVDDWLREDAKKHRREIADARALVTQPAAEQPPFAAALAGLSFAYDSDAFYGMSPSTQAVVRQISRGTLAAEIEMALKGSRGVYAARWRAISQSLGKLDNL
jgi:hypothetical protein